MQNDLNILMNLVAASEVLHCHICEYKCYRCLSWSWLQVLDVLRSLCVCNGVAVRSNQNLITENLLPGRELLLQTNIVNYVTR